MKDTSLAYPHRVEEGSTLLVTYQEPATPLRTFCSTLGVWGIGVLDVVV